VAVSEITGLFHTGRLLGSSALVDTFTIQMRARRLPLGSPSQRKERTEDSLAVETPNSANSTSTEESERAGRARPRQAPAAATSGMESGRNKDKLISSRTRRKSRGLPLSRSSSHDASEAAEPKAAATAQIVSRPERKAKTEKTKTPPTLNSKKVVNSEKPKTESTSKPNGSNSGANSPKRRRSPPPSSSSSVLVGVRPDGSRMNVKVLIGNMVYNPLEGGRKTPPPPTDITETIDGMLEPAATTTTPKATDVNVGIDGNQFFCAECGGLGDVICCDGCPKVYHRACIPVTKSPPKSLDEDDPWFCPSCTEEGKDKKNGDQGLSVASPQPSVAQSEVGSDEEDSKIKSLIDTGNRVWDSLGNVSATPAKDSNGHEKSDDVAGEEAATKRAEPSTPPPVKRELRRAAAAAASVENKRPERKRKSPLPPDGEVDDDEAGKVKAKKKKKKKLAKKESMDPPDVGFVPPVPAMPTGTPDIAQATPAFFFFMTENRWKIEKVLAKRDRTFAKTTKGGLKNAMVAAEAASWWSKLEAEEQQRYVDMSMRDFEKKIIAWKEDKAIREMGVEGDTAGENDGYNTHMSEVDDELTWQRHQRLYLSTSVGSKPFKPEPDQAYNRVLQDLLHDMRFHPLPMLGIDRPQDDEKQEDDAAGKVLIPYFDVHGPSSTSVGDSCLGCQRSWNHFCPVLQRRVPAVEHRARLQPPMSSLLATRVGLGLRPPFIQQDEPDENPEPESDMNVWKMTKERKEMLNMPVLQTCTLDSPNDRMDDVVLFIEETTAMKVPEPSRPQDDGDGSKKSNLRSLPLAAPKTEEPSKFRKCGRCRTIIQGDTGCVQCRRAQLVINTAKRQKQEGKSLKVQTYMIGRYNAKEPSETQSAEDQAVAAAMLRERWMPSAVLPAISKLAPGSSPATKLSHFPYCAPIAPESNHSKDADLKHDREVAAAAAAAIPTVHSPDDSGNEEPDQEKRSQRPNRMATLFQDGFEPGERQSMLERNRKAVNVFQKKAVEVACCGMLQALLRRDPLMLFDQHVTAEGYRDVVKKPILFSNIREKLLEHQYQSMGAFVADTKLLCENALAFNAPGSIYANTASEMLELITIMQKRASAWVSAVKDSYSAFLNSDEAFQRALSGQDIEESSEAAFNELRKEWPEAVRLLEMQDWLKGHVESDFYRTKENEIAYFGSLSVSRVSAAAEASLAPYTDSGDLYGIATKRSHKDDAALRQKIDEYAGKFVGPLSLSTPSTWREESVHRLLRKVQSRRLDRRTASEQGCARCDGQIVDEDVKLNMRADAAQGKVRKSEDSDLPRVDGSRVDLTTGRASANGRATIKARRELHSEQQHNSVEDSSVSVRGSRIHGLGLFADQEFKKGDVVAEYVGEYISNAESEIREASYRERRIQDYSFRIGPDLVIDATCKGGPARYANHNCTPNCASKIIPGEGEGDSFKRVLVVAIRNIKINEELTYDYQFPLEQDLAARIPCNCRSEECRGFMNWDLPEKGSNNRAVLVQKRGANMRDRIRRLNRPLKRDEM